MIPGKRLFTPEQEKWMGERYAHMTNAELVSEIETEFGVSCTQRQLVNWAKRRGIRKSCDTMRRTRVEMGKKNRIFNDEMLDWLRGYVPGHVYPEIADEFEKRFGWRLSHKQYDNMRMKYGIKSGVRGYGCFKKGNVPANKGKKWDEFVSPETQERIRSSGNLFKKGHRPHNAYHELLDERTDQYGTWVYVSPRNAKHQAGKWIPKSHFVWMQHNGRDFPANHKCVFADHDKQNLDPENLVAIPNDVYGVVTGGAHAKKLEYWDRETLELAIMHARLIMKRHEIEKNKPRVCEVCGKVFRPTGKKLRWGDRVRTCDECSTQGKRAPMKKNRRK